MLYEIIIFIGSAVARAISLFDKKMARFFSLRKNEIERVSEYFRENKNKKSKVIWFHSSSAGELEQSKPLIDHFKRSRKNLHIIASFFSPSGYDAGLKYKSIDFCFNLPLDYGRNAVKLLDLIAPQIIIYSKYDVWTNLTLEAKKRKVKLALISAALPEKSLRHRLPFSNFFKKAYSSLDKIYAISGDDAGRFKKISGKKNIAVSGDTRFDRVKTVIANSQLKSKNIVKKQRGIIYLLAGSTYKKCEKNLIAVLNRLNAVDKNIRLIIVPHEIDRDNIQRLNKLFDKNGYNPVNYTNTSHPVLLEENNVLIVDAFGILAFLYKEADIVFVGGSYKGSVHSVLEPAVFGRPIVTGPYIQNSYEAIKLNDIGGLKKCDNRDELYKEIFKLSNDEYYRKKVSRNSKIFFDKNIGSAAFILKDIEKLL
jgi:3-deoxy-D-manno-octulosonic-acid transferase